MTEGLLSHLHLNVYDVIYIYMYKLLFIHTHLHHKSAHQLPSQIVANLKGACPLPNKVAKTQFVQAGDENLVHPNVKLSAFPETTYKLHGTLRIQEVSAVSAKDSFPKLGRIILENASTFTLGSTVNSRNFAHLDI